MKKLKAIVTGANGQDGSYLTKLLLDKGYSVFCIFRPTTRDYLANHHFLKIDENNKNLKYIDLSITEYFTLQKIIKDIKPNEIYNLAGQTYVYDSFTNPLHTVHTNSIPVLYFLEIIKNFDRKIKFYQASSSEMYGSNKEIPLSEDSILMPSSPYAVSKVFSHQMVINYRESYNMFCSNGILFNHESPIRGLDFVTRKITRNFAKIYYQKQKNFSLGNIFAERDWGHAEDYVNAIWKILQYNKPDDFVIATGKKYSVKYLVEYVASSLGYELVWKKNKKNMWDAHDKKTNNILIKTTQKNFRPKDVECLLGDSSKARKKLNWKPKHDFSSLIDEMIEADLKREKNQA